MPYALSSELNLSEEQSAFFSEIGVAITQWAHVEDALRHVVLACFDNSDGLTYPVLSLGFFSIENFRSKLDFTSALVKRKFAGSKHLGDWAKLFERTRRASQQRNKLVHRLVQLYPHNRPGRRVMLTPWIFKKPKKRPKQPRPPDGSLGIRDLIQIRFEFQAVFVSLENFRHRVRNEPEPFPKAAEQAMRPPTTQGIKRVIRASADPT